MLRACHRVLRPGGRLSFLVIAVAAGLTSQESHRAHAAGPARVGAGDGYASLLDHAGYRDIVVRDVSAAYRSTAAAWIREWDSERAELERLLGVEAFAERQSSRRHALAVIDEGLLGRYLFTAARP